MSCYDVYDTANTVLSPETSLGEKGTAVGLAVAGAFLPGGGYSKIDDVARASKRIVIGENMQRVRGAAKKIGAETFEGKGMEANRAWIRSKVKEGYEVHDIGPDFARRAKRAEQGARPDSPFYNMERMETKGCSGYQKHFERTWKYEGGTPGIDW